MEILVDTAKSVRKIREAQGMNAPNVDAAGRSSCRSADAGGGKPGGAGHTGFYKQGLLASHSLAIVEMSLPDLSIVESSHAFRGCLRGAAIGGAAAAGAHHPAHPPKFGDLIPRGDLLALHAFIQKVCDFRCFMEITPSLPRIPRLLTRKPAIATPAVHLLVRRGGVDALSVCLCLCVCVCVRVCV